MGSPTGPGSHLQIQNGADLTHISLKSWTVETEAKVLAVIKFINCYQALLITK